MTESGKNKLPENLLDQISDEVVNPKILWCFVVLLLLIIGGFIILDSKVIKMQQRIEQLEKSDASLIIQSGDLK